MLKSEFIECANVLKTYWNWENNLSHYQIDISGTPAGKMADFLVDFIEYQDDSAGDWSYDPIVGFDWVVTWCSASPNDVGFARKGQWIYLNDAGALYDFVKEMRSLDWPEEVVNRRWLDE